MVSEWYMATSPTVPGVIIQKEIHSLIFKEYKHIPSFSIGAADMLEVIRFLRTVIKIFRTSKIARKLVLRTIGENVWRDLLWSPGVPKPEFLHGNDWDVEDLTFIEEGSTDDDVWGDGEVLVKAGVPKPETD